MSDYEMLIVMLTFGMLIVSIIALCYRTKKPANKNQELVGSFLF